MLADLEASVIRAILGAPLQVKLDNGTIVEGKIADVKEGAPRMPNVRAPFSFIVQTSRTNARQGMIVLMHETFGADGLGVFAVPLQPTEDAQPWEIIFS